MFTANPTEGHFYWKYLYAFDGNIDNIVNFVLFAKKNYTRIKTVDVKIKAWHGQEDLIFPLKISWSFSDKWFCQI